jgi:glycosyltransferase involved in cell wall biosynthesis
MMRRKRVLVVHYFFPPLGGAGVPRVLKWVKYLPEYGWDVTVITSTLRPSWYAARDETLLAEIPQEVRVVRVGELPVAWARRKGLGTLNRLHIPQLASYIAWPDEIVGWLPAAAVAALRTARQWRPDVVLSSSYPYTSHLVALATSSAQGIPWVADFRDPWTLNRQGSPAPWPLPRFNARLERRFARDADRVIVVDDHEEIRGLSHDDPRRIVIENGVDETDFDVASPGDASTPSERFRLTYVGTLYGTRDATPVFDAAERLVAAGVIDAERFEVVLVGNVWLGGRSVSRERVPVRQLGYVPHSSAVEEMRAATALLFYAPGNTWAPSGKIFEYLIARRPILCIARPDNLAHDLVVRFGAGVAAAPGDPAGIERALASLYKRWETGTLDVASDVRERTLARFSRRRLTARLADVLETVVDESASERA